MMMQWCTRHQCWWISAPGEVDATTLESMSPPIFTLHPLHDPHFVSSDQPWFVLDLVLHITMELHNSHFDDLWSSSWSASLKASLSSWMNQHPPTLAQPLSVGNLCFLCYKSCNIDAFCLVIPFLHPPWHPLVLMLPFFFLIKPHLRRGRISKWRISHLISSRKDFISQEVEMTDIAEIIRPPEIFPTSESLKAIRTRGLWANWRPHLPPPSSAAKCSNQPPLLKSDSHHRQRERLPYQPSNFPNRL